MIQTVVGKFNVPSSNHFTNGASSQDAWWLQRSSYLLAEAFRVVDAAPYMAA
jgi:hypothetical protein